MTSDQSRIILEKVRQIEVRTRRLVDEALAGHYHSVFKGRGMDFDRVREYVRGDEMRDIDWNVTARSGEPFVKIYTEERELCIVLFIDVSASSDFGSSEQSKRDLAAEVGSVLAFSAIRNNDKVGLILFTDEIELYIPPAKGRTHILRLIREILFFEPRSTGTDIAGALDFMNRVTTRRSVAFVVSDFRFPGEFESALGGFRAKLSAMNRRHDVVCLAIDDPRESKLPDIGTLVLEDSETGDVVALHTRDSKVREAFTALADRRREILGRGIRSAGVDLLELSTDESYLPRLLNFFQTRERRANT